MSKLHKIEVVYTLTCKVCHNNRFMVVLKSKNAYDIDKLVCPECDNEFYWHDYVYWEPDETPFTNA